jgi:hypothetical protein
MNNDNVYQPRGGYLPTEPERQAVERDDEIKRTLAAIPVLNDEVTYLDSRIAFYESVHSVSDEALTNPEVFMHIIAGNKVAAQNLTIERDALLGRIQEASKE